ncbi:hypothetical protein SAY86_031651 [Trapa natans]|uniref:Uncharacterized protein n=1 Tax=Trapa natans TaxID=22666 RepID=A0AAN7R9X1_TRANT|nr:hypothetical protein SAY86_031651 [Trapa natans]
MGRLIDHRLVEENHEDYTQDGTVDIKGRPVLRSKTGRWRACTFIIGYEIFERIAYHGVATSLVLYLSKKFHEGTVASTTTVSNWAGTVWLMPIFGAYIADAHLGRYFTFLIASLIYITGMGLLTMSASLPSLKPPTCPTNIKDEECTVKPTTFQQVFFLFALYVIALGNGGTKPNISSMGADQFDDLQPKEKDQKNSFFNWWMFGVFTGSFIANTVVMWVQENFSWGMGYAIQTIGLTFALCLFLVGTPFYRHQKPHGSSYDKIFKVLVAAIKKSNVPIPSDPKELHELSLEEYKKMEKNMISNSPALRFLDKAAVKTEEISSWTLCTVTQVEETKQLLKMVPIFIATIIPSLIFSQVQTFFIKQGVTLNRHLTSSFEIPSASLKSLVQIFMLISLVLYDRFFIPAMRRRTKNPRGITMLQRMGIGMFLYILIMVSAYISERSRHALISQNPTNPPSVLIILPQFALLGIADTFLEVAKLEFFYDQAPTGMKSLGTSYYSSSMGLGSFANVFMMNIINTLSKRNGRPGWLTNNLNKSHLDYYYAVMTGLAVVNLFYYLAVAKYYTYNVDPVNLIEGNVSSLQMEDLPSTIDETKET